MALFRELALLVPVTVLAACSFAAPPYLPSVDNIQSLKTVSGAHAKVGTFEAQPGDTNRYPVTLRADSMRSPVGTSFAAYLSSAIQTELSIAGVLSSDPNIEVSGTLLTNEVSVGIGTGTGTMSARFIVKHGGEVSYDRVKTVKRDWESSFVAAIAVPRAVQEYPLVVQTLLAALYADPDFMLAIK